MPTGTHTHTPRTRHGEPQPAPPPTASEPASARRDLTSWWKQFSKRNVKKEEEKDIEVRGIFGVPLITSIPYANVAISLFNETGESYIYGYVPIVVAKCGVFLKEKATDVEGIFRLPGSEKRIKELKIAFDTPPRYGKGLDWTGYTVHDAANILRRYFNQLPEPIIPLQHYDTFRQPLRNHQGEAVGHLEGQAPSIGGFNSEAAVRIYQHLIKELPSLNRQLLLYILDLLAVFAAKFEVNKMTTFNLAAIFQPGILSHPQHDMSPADYRFSQDVLIFLIDNQDNFLIGMEGTAVDEGTVKHVESGPSSPQARTPTTPGRNKSGLGRSASTTSSAGAESLRKYGTIRRNVSTSSRQSRHSGAIPSPTATTFATSGGSGVHRSNTLPSKKSPVVPGARFQRDRGSDPPTPVADEIKTYSPASALAYPLMPEQQPIELQPIPASQLAVQPASQSAVQSVSQPAVQPVSQPAVQPQPLSQPAVQLIFQPAEQQLPAPGRPVQHIQPDSMESAQSTQPVQPTQPEQPATPTHSVQLVQPSQPTEQVKQLEKPNIVQPTTEGEREGLKTADVMPTVITPSLEFMPGAFPLPSPGIVPAPSEGITPTATSQAAQVLATPSSPQNQRSPRLTAVHDRSEFVGGPIDAGPSQEFAPTVRTFTQILSKVSPVSEEKQSGRRPNKLQKKRAPGSTNPSAHSSTHSLSGNGALDGPPSPPHPGSIPHQHPSFSKEALQSFNSDPVSSRNSGATLKPSMSPSASFRSHSTATEYSEAEHADETPKEEKRSFWKSHRRAESRATPTASQTDLHGFVPGANKSMSSFGSSSGAGPRRSLQYDSQQRHDLSAPYGAADKEHGEKKKPFDWFRKGRQEHKDHRTDKKIRAMSPPGSSSDLMNLQNLARPQENLPVRGKSMDVPRTATSEEGSSDVTPTGTSPNPGPVAAPSNASAAQPEILPTTPSNPPPVAQQSPLDPTSNPHV
ncbi:hypothetical protein BDV95DRAFT_592984 [Massariosphaeria phaeospora]|uniref:Rho-GAP domain-containing protein n=1 Tax=Massariosphaeria phaeospora TaxID=100035 RepID=A0A7C8I8Y8_9PLEO|nr:hypothetical protein BDV95DRAFT_592984 [Massariosphaeria phaeospora]